MSALTLETKNAASYSNQAKNTSPVTQFLRHGKNPSMEDLANYTFASVVFSDGTQLKDLTFSQLSDIIWNLQTKN